VDPPTTRGGGEGKTDRPPLTGKKRTKERTRDGEWGMGGGRHSLSSTVGFLRELSQDEEGEGMSSSSSSGATLDRFGFATPTEEDVFPLPSDDVVRMLTGDWNRVCNVAMIARAMRWHLGVNDTFNDEGHSVHVEGGGGKGEREEEEDRNVDGECDDDGGGWRRTTIGKGSGLMKTIRSLG
jgi:hypothetical protein